MSNRFPISLLAALLVVIAFFTGGCWDRKEIENRGLVLGMGIDYASPEPKGKYDIPHVTEEFGSRLYRITYELPRFRKLEGERDRGEPGQHIILKGEGESIFAISRAMGAKIYPSLFFEDLQILVINEAVARDGIADLLDFFTRNPGMRRRVKLFVTPGKAEDILSGQLQINEINSMFIAKTSRNVTRTPRFASLSNLGDISQAIRNSRAFFMPVIVLENGEVKLTSVALFSKDGKYVGVMDEWEIIGAKIIRTVLKEGVFTIPNPENPKKIVAFELLESRTNINSFLEGDQLKFKLEAKFTGNLGEKSVVGEDALDENFLTAVENALSEQFTRQVFAAYGKAQLLKADMLDLGWLAYRQHPQYWKQVEKTWDEEVFPTVPLEVDIRVIVRRPGLTR